MKPVLLVIAGPNGSGKTTVTTRLREERWSEAVQYVVDENAHPDERDGCFFRARRRSSRMMTVDVVGPFRKTSIRSRPACFAAYSARSAASKSR